MKLGSTFDKLASRLRPQHERGQHVRSILESNGPRLFKIPLPFVFVAVVALFITANCGCWLS